MSGEASGDVERTVRGRGGFRGPDPVTIPAGISNLCAPPQMRTKVIRVMSNFIKIRPMQERQVHLYRVDFDPEVESVRYRSKLFRTITQGVFNETTVYDGYSDARSTVLLDKTLEKVVEPLYEECRTTKVTIKLVGQLTWDSFEMLRMYNLNMLTSMKILGFYKIGANGAYVHPNLRTEVGTDKTLCTVRGYKTAAGAHENDQILMKLESTHKLMQYRNVFEYMDAIRQRGPRDLKEAVRGSLTGKLIVAAHNKRVYKIENVNFDMSPASTFTLKKENKEIAYGQYFESRYNLKIKERRQPMLLVVDNNRRKEQQNQEKECYMIPELCNIAGLTDEQRENRSIKMDLIRASQVSPADRVQHMMAFLKEVQSSERINNMLKDWGYSYEEEPIKMEGFVLDPERIGFGPKAMGPAKEWDQADAKTGGFENVIKFKELAKAPKIDMLAIMISRPDMRNKATILGNLKAGFDAFKMQIGQVVVVDINEGDSAQLFRSKLSEAPRNISAVITILPNQTKDRYDAIKKLASCDKGIITQAVTSRLMTDDKKARSAAAKIALQVAAKCGGEPWFVDIPISGVMVCGYDTYHDSTQRGRSYGAFVASMNRNLTRWFSKADRHERLDELSTNMAANLEEAMKKWNEVNGCLPGRVLIYRDGVGDGQLKQVYETELKQVLETVKRLGQDIKLTVTIVTKRVGARFYMRQQNTFVNSPPGSVFDTVVTRRERYDFYLISQSTARGTVTPTYYNIIHDESGYNAGQHQKLAYKLCFLYYNWTGTVRVPAPCQYAHKLALLCGENLHGIPHSSLDDRLHFL